MLFPSRTAVGLKIPHRTSTVVATPASPALTPILEAIPSGWFAQLFHVKPAVRRGFCLDSSNSADNRALQAYIFHSGKNFPETRTECAALLRSLGVSVEEVENVGKYGLLRCHVDNIQGMNSVLPLIIDPADLD